MQPETAPQHAFVVLQYLTEMGYPVRARPDVPDSVVWLLEFIKQEIAESLKVICTTLRLTDTPVALTEGDSLDAAQSGLPLRGIEFWLTNHSPALSDKFPLLDQGWVPPTAVIEAFTDMLHASHYAAYNMLLVAAAVPPKYLPTRPPGNFTIPWSVSQQRSEEGGRVQRAQYEKTALMRSIELAKMANAQMAHPLTDNQVKVIP